MRYWVILVGGAFIITLMDRFFWTARRLAAMSGAEVVSRFGQAFWRAEGRFRGGWGRYRVKDARILPFRIDPDHLAWLARWCQEDWARIYQEARDGRWHYLGRRWPGVKGPKTWHLDPVTGAAWPSAPYCFDIDFRHQAGFGDVKYVWEVNRLHFLPPIAALAGATGDAEAVRYCLDTIFSWAEANPPFRGVNWACGIELALRAISILLSVSLLAPTRLSDRESRQIGSILNAHAVWLMRYPSRYSSANNHLVAEAAGLYVLGALVPALPGAARYRAYGRRVLNQEVEKQILADGVGAEQSPSYGAFTAELYLIALVAAGATGDALAPVVENRLARGLEFLRWITDERGNQPRFGDDDEGRVIVSRPGVDPHYISALMSGLAAITGRADLAPPLAVPHLRDVFLTGAFPGKVATIFQFENTTKQRVRAFSLVEEKRKYPKKPAPPVPGPRGCRAFDEGGYSVFRENLAGRDTMLVFDHGPLGYLSIAAHGHADALAVWLHVDGRPVIVDAGTYLYHSGGAARDRFRGTGAHNTLQINGADQSTIAGAFNWAHKARAWRVEAGEGPDSAADAVTARHDGYKKRFGVIHERRVERNGAGFILSDRLEGPLAAITDTVLRFYLDPSIAPRREAGGALVLCANGAALARLSFRTAAGDRLAAAALPAEISPHFGGTRPCTLIAVTPPQAAWSAGGTVVTHIQFS